MRLDVSAAQFQPAATTLKLQYSWSRSAPLQKNYLLYFLNFVEMIMYKSKQLQEFEQRNKHQRLELTLVGINYSQYQNTPQLYLLEKIKNNSPWPEASQNDILSFLRAISALYNPIPYHNLTHAFDVMHLDLFLTTYGWQHRLQISHHKRIYMLIAAYAHDAGHEGLTNAFYKNSNHPLATYSQSPLQYMHASHLRRLLREHKLEVPISILEELTEMILRTDNYYHGWLLEKGAKLRGQPDSVLKDPKNSLTISCLLLHAADLNNTCKQTEMSVLWTKLLFEQFQFQDRLQSERGLKSAMMSSSSPKEKAQSNVYFLAHMVMPLYQEIADLEPKFVELMKKLERNRTYWQIQANKL